MNTKHLTFALDLKSTSGRKFGGHGSIFGNEDLGGDIVVPGAFAKSLAQHRKAGTMPQMFWMHDPSRVPGKWLEMSEDDDGLGVEGVLAETPLGEEARVLMKMDAVRGLSIGYATRDWDYDKEGRRLLKEVELIEVSIVSMAMNPLAKVEHVKSQLSAAGEYVPSRREMEKMLRQLGMHQLAAKRFLSNAYDGTDAARDVRPGVDPARDVLEDEEAKALVQSLTMRADRFFAEALRR